VAFVTTDNALYSIAFKIHTKTAESIEMPFGMISGLGPRNSVLRGGDDPQREIGNFGGKHVPDKPNTVKKLRIGLVHAAAHDRGRRLIASVGRVCYQPQSGAGIAHRGRSLISTIALFIDETYSILSNISSETKSRFISTTTPEII